MGKKTALLTDWVNIGRSGPTADGRTIEAFKLREAAETYNPEDYTAQINEEHFWGNYGQVRELRVQEEGEVVHLQARLEPNMNLMLKNQRREKLFTSMELKPNFAESGKYYLSGLALTDKPASLGTTELRFSASDKGPERGEAVELPAECFSIASPDGDKDKEDSLVDRIVDGVKRSLNFSKKPENKEDTEMNAEQFSQMMAGQQTLTESVNKLVESFASKEPEKKEPETKQPEQAEAGVSQEQFNKLMEGQQALTESLSALTDKFAAAAGEQPGTKVPENSGAESGEPAFV